MCITGSVGKGGVNQRADAKVVQALLNENLYRLNPGSPLAVDGVPGTQTQNVIGEFQRQILNVAQPDCLVSPGGPTLRELGAGVRPGLTADKLQAIMTNASVANASRFLAPLTTLLAANQIDTSLRIAHFLAQIGHESGDLKFTEEIASGEAYEGRADLGNTQPGDGVRFKGRGLIQITGRANYAAFGAARQRDFTTEPNNRLLATDDNLAVDASVWFWTTHGLNALADADNLNSITRRINGGLNGLADRAAHLQRAKCFLL